MRPADLARRSAADIPPAAQRTAAPLPPRQLAHAWAAGAGGWEAAAAAKVGRRSKLFCHVRRRHIMQRKAEVESNASSQIVRTQALLPCIASSHTARRKRWPTPICSRAGIPWLCLGGQVDREAKGGHWTFPCRWLLGRQNLPEGRRSRSKDAPKWSAEPPEPPEPPKPLAEPAKGSAEPPTMSAEPPMG